MRAALVTTHWDDPWSEEDLAVRRVAGAVACFAHLDVLVPGTRETVTEPYAAVRLIRYEASPTDEASRTALRHALFGPSFFETAAACVCRDERTRAFARDLAPQLQWAGLVGEGGESEVMPRLLSEQQYDVVLFAGCSAATYAGMMALRPTTPVVFLPLLTHRPVEWISLLDEAFERADAVLVFTEAEARAARTRAPESEGKLTNIGFVVRVHELAYGNAPHGYEIADRVVIVTDWRDPAVFDTFRLWLTAAARDFPGVDFRPLGPGADRLPFPHGTPLSGGQLDTWRWVARSLGALDPLHHRLLGRTVLEALHYGVPVLVPADGGASREHAEVGNGGLWYRAAQDLGASIALLREDFATWQELATRGRTYAQEIYGDPKQFISRVTDAIGSITD